MPERDFTLDAIESIEETQRLVAALKVNIARLSRTIEHSKELCEPGLFVKPYQRPWLPFVLSKPARPASKQKAIHAIA
jgi:hypothetical protein